MKPFRIIQLQVEWGTVGEWAVILKNGTVKTVAFVTSWLLRMIVTLLALGLIALAVNDAYRHWGLRGMLLWVVGTILALCIVYITTVGGYALYDWAERQRRKA